MKDQFKYFGEPHFIIDGKDRGGIQEAKTYLMSLGFTERESSEFIQELFAKRHVNHI